MNEINRNNIIFELNKINKHCCGCTACVFKCYNNAIYMKIDEKGFYNVSINNLKCVNCGICISVCPIVNKKENNSKNPEKYAFSAPKEIIDKSSSGGVFTVLAQHVLNNSGVVVGAAYTNKFEVEHIIIDSINELYKLRMSKYVQSNQHDCYKKVK